jgi:hypothetical protein
LEKFSLAAGGGVIENVAHSFWRSPIFVTSIWLVFFDVMIFFGLGGTPSRNLMVSEVILCI